MYLLHVYNSYDNSSRHTSAMTFLEGLTGPLTKLQSDKSSKRLELIAGIRSYGIANHINLPQLAVGGDQSSGKSSALEGITGLPFPRQDGLCTRFPTEIILTHTEDPFSVEAEIIPCDARPDNERLDLAAWKRNLSDLQQIHTIIDDAASSMGLRGYGNNSGPTFSEDVLRIHIRGPTGMHLSIVDLPGLISVASEEQTEEDVQTVHKIVDSYVSNPRTIILAVVQATNDIANQGIIQKSKVWDKTGQRTVGIITKPDLINQGTEPRVAALAKNQDTTKLKLGFFLLKNPAPKELKAELSFEQRERAERAFFSRTPWQEQSLDMSRVGTVKLRAYLQDLLDNHIKQELPKVRQDLSDSIARISKQLEDLGEARPSTAHIRIFLSQLAMRFYTLTSAALQGDYHIADASFFHGSEQEYIRLRAFVHNANTQFSDALRESGMALKLRGTTLRELIPEPTPCVKDGVWEHCGKKFGAFEWESAQAPSAEDLDEALPTVVVVDTCNADQDGLPEPEMVTEAGLKAWILEVCSEILGTHCTDGTRRTGEHGVENYQATTIMCF